MIKFQNKNKNIINLALPTDVKSSTRHYHKQHITDDSIRKWNINTADGNQRKRVDRKHEMMMTQ